MYLKQTMLQGYTVCSCSVFSICAACNVMSNDKNFSFHIGTSRSLCAVPSMAVFPSPLISCFPVMLLRYCLNDFEMVSVAPVINGVLFYYYGERNLLF